LTPGSRLSNLLSLALFFFHRFLAFGGVPLNLAEEAGQDAHVRVFESCPPEDAAKGEEDVLLILKIRQSQRYGFSATTLPFFQT
jgi:hypothetical protein